MNQVGDGNKTQVGRFLISFCTVCQLGDKPRCWRFYRASAPNFCQDDCYMDHPLYERSQALPMASIPNQTQLSGVKASMQGTLKKKI